MKQLVLKDKDMNNGYTFTKQAEMLYEELLKRGIEVTKEHWDGHKHIDIAILPVHLFIEIDGIHHYTNPQQIEADFKRDHFSDGDDYDTIRIPNSVIESHLPEVVEAICQVVSNRL